jgi:hypothetical protein
VARRRKFSKPTACTPMAALNRLPCFYEIPRCPVCVIRAPVQIVNLCSQILFLARLAGHGGTWQLPPPFVRQGNLPITPLYRWPVGAANRSRASGRSQCFEAIVRMADGRRETARRRGKRGIFTLVSSGSAWPFRHRRHTQSSKN